MTNVSGTTKIGFICIVSEADFTKTVRVPVSIRNGAEAALRFNLNHTNLVLRDGSGLALNDDQLADFQTLWIFHPIIVISDRPNVLLNCEAPVKDRKGAVDLPKNIIFGMDKRIFKILETVTVPWTSTEENRQGLQFGQAITSDAVHVGIFWYFMFNMANVLLWHAKSTLNVNKEVDDLFDRFGGRRLEDTFWNGRLQLRSTMEGASPEWRLAVIRPNGNLAVFAAAALQEHVTFVYQKLVVLRPKRFVSSTLSTLCQTINQSVDHFVAPEDIDARYPGVIDIYHHPEDLDVDGVRFEGMVKTLFHR